MKKFHKGATRLSTFTWLVGFMLMMPPLAIFPQTSSLLKTKYWIEFRDKGDLTQVTPKEILSPAALENRKRKGIAVDFRDYPIHQAYSKALTDMGINPLRTSRWMNSVSALLNSSEMNQVRQLPFVKSIHPVAHSRGYARIEMDCDSLPDANTPLQQLSMVGLDQLHAQQFTGEGITIAVFDNGFRGADNIDAFRPVFEEGRLIATRDFVDGDGDVFGACAHCRHGTWVWSILASDGSQGLIGSAPDASYILLRTENDDSETHQEEDNWLAAAEYADSLGAQVFSTSLGYFTFDPGEGNYTRDDLDGNTTIITRAADLAASRGILVVNSAGNSGPVGLSAPADGDSVIAVAAVDVCETAANFSSHGFVSPLKVKPDVAALGKDSFFLNSAGNIRRGNGTSFSCPIISGLVACLLQAEPEASFGELYDALIRSADRFGSPDSIYGYGIPQAGQALEWLRSRLPANPEGCGYVVFPNPSVGDFHIAPSRGCALPENLIVELIDMQGRMVLRQQQQNPGLRSLTFSTNIAPGVYQVRITDKEAGKLLHQDKVIVQP